MKGLEHKSYEGTGTIQFGEEEALHNDLKGDCGEVRPVLFLQGINDRMRANSLRSNQVTFRLGIRKKTNLLQKSGQALEQVAQGGVGIPVLGGVQKTCRYVTQILVGMVLMT